MRYEQLEVQLRTLAKRSPNYTRLTSVGSSPKGREIWMLAIGAEPDSVRPAVCVTAGLHAREFVGSEAAVGMAERLLRPLANEAQNNDLWDRAFAPLFYIIPMVSPDGMDSAVTGAAVSRSAPRQVDSDKGKAAWLLSDLNHDGQVRQIRMQHAAGEFVAHERYHHVLIPRKIRDHGPFYKVFPEGLIRNFDGNTVPDGSIGDGTCDFNRNFPHRWEGTTSLAGEFPGSEPETRAVLEFASRHPEIFAWLDLHSFGGVLLRPPFSRRDALVPGDLAIYEDIGRAFKRHYPIPLVSAIDHMTPDVDRPMIGTLCDWAFHTRGSIALVLELWDVFTAAGIDRVLPFHRNYQDDSADKLEKLIEWDLNHNGGGLFAHWMSFNHPQLGPVEIGGLDPIRGYFNPPDGELSVMIDKATGLGEILAMLRPMLDGRLDVDQIGPNLHRVTLSLVNRGYVSTTIVAHPPVLNAPHGIELRISAAGGKLVSGPPRLSIPDLSGWGRGASHENNGPFFPASAGFRRHDAEWIVAGEGELCIEIGSPRLGYTILKHRLNEGAT